MFRKVSKRGWKSWLLAASIGLVALAMACAAPAATPEAPAEKPATPEAPAEKPAAKAAPAEKPAAKTPEPPADAEWQELIKAAQAEGSVVVQAVVNSVERKELPAAFKAEFGISVEYLTLPSREATTRVLAEAEAGKVSFDIMFSGQSDLANRIHAAEILMPLRPLFVLAELNEPNPDDWVIGKPWFMDPDESILRVQDYLTPLVQVNLEFVPEGSITSSADLLDPKWKGMIAINDPAVPGPGASHISIMMRANGEQFVIDLIDGQEATLTRDRGQLADWLADGTYPISIGVPSREVKRLNDEGFEIAMLSLTDIPTPRGPGSGMMVIFKDAPHPKAAQLLMNWILTKDIMQQYVTWNQSLGTRSDLDYAFLDPVLVPEEGKDYFDTAEWIYTTQERSKEFTRLRELFAR